MARFSGLAYLVTRYVTWLALCGLSLWATLMVRINMLDVIFHLRTSRWAIPALDKFGTVALILAWLGMAIYLESYLTDAPHVAAFRQRALRVAAVCAAILLVSYALQALL